MEILDIFERLRIGSIDEDEAVRLLADRRRRAFWAGFFDGLAAPVLFWRLIFK